MRRSATCGQPKNHLSVKRKKNGGCHPTGSRARGRAVAANHLRRCAQDGSRGFGSCRDAGALGHASGGARALTELLRFPTPNQYAIPCPCGQQAMYRELRSKTVLTAVGTVEVSRPYLPK